MSAGLDEAALGKKVKNIIIKYGRPATFYEGDDSTNHPWYITPPRASETSSPDGNAQEEALLCLSPAKDIPFSMKRMNRVIDSKDSRDYRIISFDPIDSGEATAAYRIRLAR